MMIFISTRLSLLWGACLIDDFSRVSSNVSNRTLIIVDSPRMKKNTNFYTTNTKINVHNEQTNGIHSYFNQRTNCDRLSQIQTNISMEHGLQKGSINCRTALETSNPHPSLFENSRKTWDSFQHPPTLMSRCFYSTTERYTNHAQASPNFQYFRRTSSDDATIDSGRNLETLTLDDAALIEHLNKIRYWEYLGEKPNKSMNFTIMSYNVLAQDLLTQHPQLYYGHQREHLNWTRRWMNFLQEIRKFSPDILCLQEVQGTHLKNYYSILNRMGYEGFYKQRTGIRTDGCAIYYKRNVFRMMEYTTVEFNQPNIKLLNRDNVAIIAKLTPHRSPRNEFIVATTHLLYNPKRQDIKLAQTQLLLTEIDRLAYKHDSNSGHYLPVILTGDLNSQPNSKIYELITKGQLVYENLTPFTLTTTNSETNIVGKTFLPSALQITDNCQHAGVISKRNAKQKISRSQELELIKLKHSENPPSSPSTRMVHATDSEHFSSGKLSHQFPFKSVYNHWVADDLEGTTFHDKWITVDYIFYSNDDNASTRSKLELLARYKLPTNKQLSNIKIPNSICGSDHFFLLAKFRF